jgi:hypothetical protein
MIHSCPISDPGFPFPGSTTSPGPEMKEYNFFLVLGSADAFDLNFFGDHPLFKTTDRVKTWN